AFWTPALREAPASRFLCDDQRHSQNAPPATITIMIPATYQSALLGPSGAPAGALPAGVSGAGVPPWASRGASPSPVTENFTGSRAGMFLVKNTARPASSVSWENVRLS